MVVATFIYLYAFFSTREWVSEELPHQSDLAGDLRALLTNAGWVVLFISGLFNLVHVAVRNGSFLFYFDYYVGDESKASLFFSSGSAMFLLGVISANFFARRFSKKNLLVFHACSLGILLCAFYLVPADQYGLMLLFNGLSSFVAGPIPVLLYVLYAEVADYTEWQTNRKVMALVFATMLIAVKAGLMLGGLLNGVLLDSYGYVPNAEQSAEALKIIVLLVSVIPGVCAILSGVTIAFYPLKEPLMRRVEEELATRRSATQTQPRSLTA
jgi:GPH family glycoside/pentoside/hexuronide:cation symporter